RRSRSRERRRRLCRRWSGNERRRLDGAAPESGAGGFAGAGAEMSAELARIGGTFACAGLGVLIVAPTRLARVAGLAAWARGGAVLLAYLAPSGHHRLLVAAAGGGLVLAVGLAAVLRRWPWALAVATLACVPARIPVHVGGKIGRAHV